MPLYLTEQEVVRLLTPPDGEQATAPMREVMDAIEAALKVWGGASEATGDEGAKGGEAYNLPRQRFFLNKGVFHHMAAALPADSAYSDIAVVGTKTYTSFAPVSRFYVQLFSAQTGELLAYIEADKLGQTRTGAATGIAARFMARPDTQRVGLFGTGWQAESQAEAMLAARPAVREFLVYGRDLNRRENFCREMTARLGVRFSPQNGLEATARTTEAIVCATTAREPFLQAEWVGPGDFVSAVGANRLTAREVDEDVFAKAAVVVVDDKEQAKQEASELLFAVERRKLSWARVRTLAEVVSGRAPGRTRTDDICVFKSLGIAVEDVATAALLYRKALALGVGTSFGNNEPQMVHRISPRLTSGPTRHGA